MSAAPPHVAINALEHAFDNDAPVLIGLRTLTAPVVAINPDNRPTDVEALARNGVAAVSMPGVGHFAMLEDPGPFNRLLGGTIGGVRGINARPLTRQVARR